MSINSIGNIPNIEWPSQDQDLGGEAGFSQSTSGGENSDNALMFASPASASSGIDFGNSASPLAGAPKAQEAGDSASGVEGLQELMHMIQQIMTMLKQSLGLEEPEAGGGEPSAGGAKPPEPASGAASPGDSKTDEAKKTGAGNDASAGKGDVEAAEDSKDGARSGESKTDEAKKTGPANDASTGKDDVDSAEDSTGGAKAGDPKDAGVAAVDQAGPAVKPAEVDAKEGPTLDSGDAVGGGAKADKLDIRGTQGDDYHYKNNDGLETFTVSNTDKPAGEPYDPRSEAAFKDESFKAGDDVKTFNGKFQVEEGDDTTIAQIINHDPNASDKHVPSAFITYEDGALYQGHKKAGEKLADIAPGEEFELTMKSNGKSTDIFVDGEHVGSADGGRQSGENMFKYGAYHHGGKDDDSVENKAVIHARDVTVS